jgi:hypothetical protein
MSIRAKLAVLLGSVAVVLAAGMGFAFASIPDGNGVIHACYQSPPPAHGANLQVIDTGAGGSCSGGMVPLTWNQTGPPGPSTAGAAGLDLIFVQASGNPPIIAYCPSDHPYVVSGGFSTNSSPVNASFPISGNGNGTGPEGTSGNGWEATDTTGSPIGVYAICAK